MAIECLIGLLRFDLGADSATAIAHRWFAHALVILVWCLMIVGIAVSLASIRRRPGAAIGIGVVFDYSHTADDC